MHTPPKAPPGRKNDRSASREFRGSPNGSLGDQVLCVDLRYDAEVSAVPTEVNVVLALVPSVVMAPMQTTMIRASMTAYSTAVGPSSRFTKLTSCCLRACMFRSFQSLGEEPVWMPVFPLGRPGGGPFGPRPGRLHDHSAGRAGGVD